jgi:hypothetical protein
MATKLPPLILEKMIKITDEILDNKESASSAGDNLAGQITDEFFIAPNILKQEDLIGFFIEICKTYTIRAYCQSDRCSREDVLKKEWLPKLVGMWLVSQKDHEYNPIHDHDGDISGVMYLKIPEYLPSRKASNPSHKHIINDDGAITFTNNCSADHRWGSPTMTIQPEVGNFYIFPSSQIHQVYPFRTVDGKGERRSVSFNAILKSQAELRGELFFN